MEKLENVTSVAAACAVFSPLWLHTLSDGAQFLLPILGVVWLLVQIYFKLTSLFRGKR